MMPSGKITRRRLLAGTMAVAGLGGGVGAGLGAGPGSGFGPATPALAVPPVPPVLSLAMAHTGERFDGAYRSPTGQLLEPAKATVDHLLRDWRTGGVVSIDPMLLDTLAAISHALTPADGMPPVFTVFSGHRSRQTNAMLFRTRAGVAWNSYHILGRAIDFRILDIDFDTQRAAADRLVAGGLGTYPTSGFLHIDTGPARRWGGGTGGGGAGDDIYEGVVIAGLPPALQPGAGGLIHRGGSVDRSGSALGGSDGIVRRGTLPGAGDPSPTVGGLSLGSGGAGSGDGLITGGGLIRRGTVPGSSPTIGGLPLNSR